MVVLSAAICTKSGKGIFVTFESAMIYAALISRQFVEMTRIRIEVGTEVVHLYVLIV